MHLPFWLTTAVLFPVLLYQGMRTRQTTPRLPEASGSPFGQYGEGEPARRILAIGESTAAGVGAQTHDQGLATEANTRNLGGVPGAGLPGPRLELPCQQAVETLIVAVAAHAGCGVLA